MTSLFRPQRSGKKEAISSAAFGLAYRRVTVCCVIENIEPRRAYSPSSRAAAIIQTIYYLRAGVRTSPQTQAGRRAVRSGRRTDPSRFVRSKGAAVCLSAHSFVCLNTSCVKLQQALRFLVSCSSAAHEAPGDALRSHSATDT